jgi:hypothetical protein
MAFGSITQKPGGKMSDSASASTGPKTKQVYWESMTDISNTL